MQTTKQKLIYFFNKMAQKNKIQLTLQDIFKEENMGLAAIGNFDIDDIVPLLTFN